MAVSPALSVIVVRKMRKEIKMLKKMIVLFASLGLILGISAVAFSAEKGNHRKGKYTYRKTCRACHNDSGTAVSLSPDSKTQAQWEKTFEPDTYQKFQCKDEWAKLSEEDLNNIFAYLHKYAYDSPTPAKCK